MSVVVEFIYTSDGGSLSIDDRGRYCPSYMDRKSDGGILATIQKREEGADQRDGPRSKDLENTNHQTSV